MISVSLFMFSCSDLGTEENLLASESIDEIKSKEERKEEFKEFVSKQVDLMNLQELDASSTELRNSALDDLDCFDPSNPGNDIWCDLPGFSKTYTVIYEGCPIQVTMSFYYCYDFTKGQEFLSTGEITNINAPWFGPQCAVHMSEILELFWAGENEELADLLDDRTYGLELGWEQQFVNEYIVANTNQTFYCDHNGDQIIIENYKGSCYAYCFNNKDGLFVWDKINCGSACCKRTSTYCVDRIAKELIENITVESLGSCNDGVPQQGCEGVLTECRNTCSKN